MDPKFDLSKSSSARDSGQVASEDLVQFSQRDLSSNTFTSHYYTEQVDFVHLDHETVLNPLMLAIKDFITRDMGCSIMFLPPSSSVLNPIELGWG